MSIHGYVGNIITANPTAPTVSSASGVWTTEQQLQAIAAGNWPGYEYPVTQSLRFNSADTAYLNRTPASASNRRTFTFSAWIKRSQANALVGIMGAGVNADSTQTDFVGFDGTNGNSLLANFGDGTYPVTTAAVLRDFSAWYHVVFAIDTTQATNTNRVKIYLNGIQQTLSGTYPPQNYDSAINTTNFHTIGSRSRLGAASNYLNGYLTEVNFINGQALEPSSFGLNDPETGVWSPKRYTGTYGTNGFYLPMNAGSTWSGYFDGSNDYLSVASNAAWQYGTGDFCVEGWFFGTTSGSLSNQYLFGRYNTSVSAYGALQLANSTTFYWYYGNGGAYGFTLGTALTTNRWYHVAVSRSGTSLRFFLDGTQVGSTQTDNTNYGGTAEFRIINAHQSSATYFPGYISNVRVVKGSAVYTANFTPSTTPLTAITNTVLLTCQSSTFIDNSTNNFTITNNGGALNQLISPFTPDVVDDASGNGNNWQPNNLDLRTTGAGADIMVDSPTAYGTDTGVGGEVRGNYCTLNPLLFRYSVGAGTLTNGNLQATGSSTYFFSTFQMPATGKWYFEGVPTAGSSTPGIGLGDLAVASTVFTNQVQYLNDGNKNVNGSQTSYGASYTTNDVIGVAVDCDAGTITFYKNNASQGAITTTVRNQFVYLQTGGSWTWVMNFGQRAFAYTAPSGFKALCTQNLPTPTIGATSTTQANDYFNAVLYTGNSSTQSITGVGFQPDWVWVKNRSVSGQHVLTDVLRGTDKQLFSSLTNAEQTSATGLTAFNADGFSLGANPSPTGSMNSSPDAFVAWNWNAGGSTVTNTSGTISAQVRANTTSGFSIVTYTGNGTNNSTVGHGLGVAPAMIIIKDRNTNSNANNWFVWHKSLPTDNNIQLNNDIAQYTLTGTLGGPTESASPTNTFKLYGGLGSTNVNESGDLFVAYCFAEVAAYSAFGSYVGNNTNDNAFVYLGFRPEFIMIKCSSTGGTNYDWLMFDVARMPYNYIANTDLRANLPGAEGSTARNPALDILSNGFKVRGSGGEIGQAQTYIYAAFAESPFKYSLAR